MSYEVQIKRVNDQLYTSRFKWTAHESSRPFMATKTRAALVAVATAAGMTIVKKWS